MLQSLQPVHRHGGWRNAHDALRIPSHRHSCPWHSGHRVDAAVVAAVGIAAGSSRRSARRAVVHGLERRIPQGSTVYLTGGAKLWKLDEVGIFVPQILLGLAALFDVLWQVFPRNWRVNPAKCLVLRWTGGSGWCAFCILVSMIGEHWCQKRV